MRTFLAGLLIALSLTIGLVSTADAATRTLIAYAEHDGETYAIYEVCDRSGCTLEAYRILEA